MSFIYAGDKLSMWAENYETDSEFNFFAENVISIEDSIREGIGQVVVMKYYNAGVLEKEQFIKDVERPIENIYLKGTIFSGWNLNTDEQNLTTFIKDYENNPHRNITGWARLQRVDPILYNKFVTISRHDGASLKRTYSFSYDNSYSSNELANTMTMGRGDNTTGAGSAQYFYNQ